MANPFDEIYTANSSPTPNTNQGSSGANENPFNDIYNSQVAQNPNDKYWQEDHGAFMAGVEGFNQSIGKLATGVLQAGTSLFGGSQALDQYQQGQQQELALAQQKHPIATTLGTVAGEVAKGAAVGAPSASASLGAQFVGYGARAAGLAAAEYGSLDDRIERGLVSGAVGGALGAGSSYLLNKISQKLFPDEAVAQKAADVYNEGGYLTLGQATNNESIMNAERGLSNIPLVGTNKGVQKATKLVEDQATRGLKELGANSSTKADLGEEVLNSIDRGYKAATKKTNDAYNLFLEQAQSSGAGNIPLENAQKAAQAASQKISALTDNVNPSQSFSSIGPKNPAIVNLLDDFNIGDDIKSIDPGSFDTLRKSLGGIIKDVKANGKDLDLLGDLKDIQKGLDQDLTNYGQAAGNNLNQLLQNARQIYQEEKLPFKQLDFLKRGTKEGVNVDTFMNSLMVNDQPNTVSLLMKNLDEDGKSAFSSALFNKVVQNATDRQGDIDFLKITDQLRRMNGTIKALPEEQQHLVNGLKKLIGNNEAFLRKGGTMGDKFAQSAAAIGAGGAAFISPTNLMTGGAVLGGISQILTNPKAVKALIRFGGGKIDKANSSALRDLFLQGVQSSVEGAPSAAGLIMAPDRPKSGQNGYLTQ